MVAGNKDVGSGEVEMDGTMLHLSTPNYNFADDIGLEINKSTSSTENVDTLEAQCTSYGQQNSVDFSKSVVEVSSEEAASHVVLPMSAKVGDGTINIPIISGPSNFLIGTNDPPLSLVFNAGGGDFNVSGIKKHKKPRAMTVKGLKKQFVYGY